MHGLRFGNRFHKERESDTSSVCDGQPLQICEDVEDMEVMRVFPKRGRTLERADIHISVSFVNIFCAVFRTVMNGWMDWLKWSNEKVCVCVCVRVILTSSLSFPSFLRPSAIPHTPHRETL